MFASLRNFHLNRLAAKQIVDNVLQWCSSNIVKYFECRTFLWSVGQSFWLQIQISRVRFPALPDFLRSRGSGTGSTQPLDDN
jgi:hypothetical protein